MDNNSYLKAKSIVNHMSKEVNELYQLYYGYYSLEKLSEALQNLRYNV